MRHERNLKAVASVPATSIQLGLFDQPVKPDRKHREKKTDAERFHEKIQILPCGCHRWTGAEDFRNGGYGRFRVGDKIWKAHQFAWFLHHGVEADGLLRHSCNDPLCCNVAHMLPGTVADNVADMMAAGRQRSGLKKEQAKLIAKFYHERGYGTKQLAGMYGVSETAIVALVTGRTHTKETGIEYVPHKPHQRKLKRAA